MDRDEAAQGGGVDVLWPDVPEVPGDLTPAGLRAWAEGHASPDIRRAALEECGGWPEDAPTRPRSEADMRQVAHVMERQESYLLRPLWLVSYLCAMWERALTRHEEAIFSLRAGGSAATAKRHVAEIYRALNLDALSFGRAYFGEAYARLVIRRARLAALDFARCLAGNAPIAVRDADPVLLALAAQNARRVLARRSGMPEGDA